MLCDVAVQASRNAQLQEPAAMLSKRLLACTAALTLATAAQAGTQVIGPLDLLPEGYALSVSGLEGSFTELFAFEVTQEVLLTAEVDTAFFARRVAGRYTAVTDVELPSLSLYYSASGSFSDGVALASASLQTVQLPGGAAEFLRLDNVDMVPAAEGWYYLQVVGNGVGSLGGGFDLYASAIALTPDELQALPVPEVDTRAMLATGLAVLAVLGWRRRAR
jgi:hypothetical protein